MAKIRILCVGNLNCDVSFQIDRFPHEHEKMRAKNLCISGGGAAANTCFWLAILGVSSAMLGVVGGDPLGEMAIESLSSVGIDVSRVKMVPEYQTNTVVVLTSGVGKRMISAGGANSQLFYHINNMDFKPFEHIHFSHSDSRVLSIIEKKIENTKVTTSVELSCWEPSDELPRANFLFINRDEFAAKFKGLPLEKIGSVLMEGQELIITQGMDGAVSITNGRISQASSNKVHVVDRTGGGDAFDAGFLQARLLGKDSGAALVAGLRLAEEVISDHGARPKIDIKKLFKMEHV